MRLRLFLAQRGYKTAPCTIETEDWMFNAAYFLMKSRHDDGGRHCEAFGRSYIAFTAAVTQIDYFHQTEQAVVLGYDPPCRSCCFMTNSVECGCD